jgi:hypothetical protein
MKKDQELIVITKTYDLILWSCNHTSRFPRNHRFETNQFFANVYLDPLDHFVTDLQRVPPRQYLAREIHPAPPESGSDLSLGACCQVQVAVPCRVESIGSVRPNEATARRVQ